jgi:hypothetical protein
VSVARWILRCSDSTDREQFGLAVYAGPQIFSRRQHTRTTVRFSLHPRTSKERKVKCNEAQRSSVNTAHRHARPVMRQKQVRPGSDGFRPRQGKQEQAIEAQKTKTKT